MNRGHKTSSENRHLNNFYVFWQEVYEIQIMSILLIIESKCKGLYTSGISQTLNVSNQESVGI